MFVFRSAKISLMHWSVSQLILVMTVYGDRRFCDCSTPETMKAPRMNFRIGIAPVVAIPTVCRREGAQSKTAFAGDD